MKIPAFKKYFLYVLLTSSSFWAVSCDEDDVAPEPAPTLPTTKGPYAQGVFITNEGNFGTPTGEVSFYDPTTRAVAPALFNTINKRPLGDVVQSMSIVNHKGYVVANNSNKIEVVNANTFQSVGVVNGLAMPRFFAASDTLKGYVTEWVSYAVAKGRVSVIDLKTNTVTKTIEVGSQPEAILAYKDRLYVANSGGNTVSVINPATDLVENTIPVKDGPNSMVIDANGMLWVLCAGKVEYDLNWNIDYTLSTKGALVKINPASPANPTVLEFPNNIYQPAKLVINGAKDRLYYVFDHTYSMATSATKLPTSPIIRRSPYGLGVSPKENVIYAGVGGYTSNGWVIRYEPTGIPIDSFQVRVLPNNFAFQQAE